MKTKKKGFTLLEVIFAVAILGMVIVMIYPSMASSFDLFRRAKDIDAVNNFATNKLEEFKQDPVKFWKDVNLTPNPAGEGVKYDKDDKVIPNNSNKEVYYYKHSYGNQSNNNDNNFYYFDNDLKPLSFQNKDKAIYKMKIWGYKKSFSKKTTNVMTQTDVSIKTPLTLKPGSNYFEAYEILNPGTNKPYDLAWVLGKSANWVDGFLAGDVDAKTITESFTGKTFQQYSNEYAASSGRWNVYYYNLRNEGQGQFRHWFYRLHELKSAYPEYPKDLNCENFNYTPTGDDYVINAILNVNSLDLNKKYEIDFSNKLKHPIELYLVYNALDFTNVNSSEIIEKMHANIKLNVLDNDVNITFLSNDALFKAEHEVYLDLYRIDKKGNTTKKYETFKTKALI